MHKPGLNQSNRSGPQSSGPSSCTFIFASCSFSGSDLRHFSWRSKRRPNIYNEEKPEAFKAQKARPGFWAGFLLKVRSTLAMQMHLLQPMQPIPLFQFNCAHILALWFAENSALFISAAAVSDVHGVTRTTTIYLHQRNQQFTPSNNQPALASSASVAVCEELSFDSFLAGSH